MNPLVRGLTWPVIALLIIGGSHLIAELLRPELEDLIGPAVIMPIHLVAGAWAGYATVRAGGTFIHGLIAGALLGLMPLALQLVGFGLILGRDPDAVTTMAIFGPAIVLRHRRRARGRQCEVVAERQLVVALRLRVDDQLRLDRAGDVAVQVVAGVDEQLRNDRLMALGADDEMEMRWAPRAPAGGRG